MRNHIFIIFIIFFGCENYFLPKQAAYLRLDYPNPEYELMEDEEFPFFFETNSRLSTISDVEINLETMDFIINYNLLNAQINFQYKKVNSREKLNTYILDLKRTIETHSMIANSAKIKDYSLKEKNIFGRTFHLSGNVASPFQFYLTDSINNIISGFIYFNIKPNYDSILPAIDYIENDIIYLIESFEWKNYNK